MSSLTRARSLRKPTTSTNTDLRPTTKSSTSEPRNASPSRLPVKPASNASGTTSARLPSGSGAPGSKIATKPAVSSLRRAVSLKQRPPSSTSGTTTTQEPVKREASRYPPSTTATRPQSMIRPTSAGGGGTGATAASASRTAHARTKSTVPSSAGTTRPPSRDASAGKVSRPPSRDPSSTARPSRPPSRDPSSTTKVSRPPSRDQSNTRTSRPPSREQTAARSTHRRVVSTDKTTSPTKTPASQTLSRTRPTFAPIQNPRSPVKSPAGKTPASPYAGPPSPSKLPANIAASAEATRLQTELLQLHMMHRDATAVEAEWHDSAKEKLRSKFDKLAKANRDVSALENAGVEAENAVALKDWASGGTLEQNIQALDTVMNGVWIMSEPGGRYERLVHRFERWIIKVCDIEEARNDHDGGYALLSKGKDSMFIEEMDSGWNDECASMTRKLEGWRQQLEGIGEDAQALQDRRKSKSSLDRMLRGASSLVFNMLAELGSMEEIERAAMAREEAWIDEMNRDGDEIDTPGAGAIWRAL